MNEFQTPVLFIVFNRPKVTFRVFEEIKKLQPSRLYIAADGPRAGKSGERKKCEQTRAITDHIDWNCELHTLFREENAGCKMAVSGAIDWFFEQEPEGIILEDDCLPDPSFFRYCEELLAKYREEEQVMTIGGSNFQPYRRTENSYYFSRHMHCWGWAGWRRAWNHYDVSMPSWPRVKQHGEVLRHYFEQAEAIKRWEQIFDKVHAGEIDTWDHQWVYAIWKNKGVNIVPEKNLISNIGFGKDATHTRNMFSSKAAMPAESMEFPLIHPDEIRLNREADRYTQKNQFTVPLYRKIFNKARSLFT